jgi:hypothetical protein
MPGYIEEYVWRRRNLVLHDSDVYRLAFLKKFTLLFKKNKKIIKKLFLFFICFKGPPLKKNKPVTGPSPFFSQKNVLSQKFSQTTK